MAEFDLEHLIGGFATNTLTEAEHQALFRAAMTNQRLFDLLADEQALKDLLDDPAVRRRLIRQLLDSPTRTESAFDRAVRWLTRGDTLAISGSVAVVIIASFFGWQLYQESQRMVREEQAKPGLSDVIREPTVRAKLGTKPTDETTASTRSAPTRPAEPPAPATPTSPTPNLADEPIPTAPASSQSTHSTPADAKLSRSEPTLAAKAALPPSPAEPPVAAQEAPTPAPPVVLPQVPPRIQEKATRKRRAEPTIEAKPTPNGEPNRSPTIAATEQRSVAAVAAEGPPPTAAQDTTSAVAPPLSTLPALTSAPAVGAARDRFLAGPKIAQTKTPTTVDAASPSAPSSGAAANDTTAQSSAPDTQSSSADSKEDSPSTPLAVVQAPLSLRYQQRSLPLQGASAGSDALHIREMRIQVNQAGYLYVITADANGAWTVLAPARPSSTREPVAIGAQDTARILMATQPPGNQTPTLIAMARGPVALLEEALKLVRTLPPAESATRIQGLVLPWLQRHPQQLLVTEQTADTLGIGTAKRATYVADIADPPADSIVYRVPE